MLLKSLKLKDFLSFGDASRALELRPLNVVIGANGSGKSNLVETIALLAAASKDLLTPIRDGGGVRHWLWKGASTSPPTASIDAVFAHPNGHSDLRYVLSFSEVAQRFAIQGERVENAEPDPGHDKPQVYYRFDNGHGVLNVKGKERQLQHEDDALTSSILARRKDPDQYPELTWLGNTLSRIRLYRQLCLTPTTPPRLPQKADRSSDMLEADAGNLALVINRLRSSPPAKEKLLDALRTLYDGIEDVGVEVQGGTVQVFLQDGQTIIPATRLSSGTLRYLCLLAILCHPSPPPLLCIEEPELGLHPDVLPKLADLLRDAAERTQLIVTTHSDVLVDALTDQPEAVVVAERSATETTLTRLDSEKLKPRLEKYRLGQLWTRGEIGGTRW